MGKVSKVHSYVLVSCALTVVEKSSEAATVEMIHDCQQQALIELKGCGELKRVQTDRIREHLLTCTRLTDDVKFDGFTDLEINRNNENSPV